MSRIIRVTGYSPKKDEAHNPVIKDFVKAFRNYKPKGRFKSLRPNIFDYFALAMIATGLASLLIGIFIRPFAMGGILLVIGLFLELFANTKN